MAEINVLFDYSESISTNSWHSEKMCSTFNTHNLLLIKLKIPTLNHSQSLKIQRRFSGRLGDSAWIAKRPEKIKFTLSTFLSTRCGTAKVCFCCQKSLLPESVMNKSFIQPRPGPRRTMNKFNYLNREIVKNMWHEWAGQLSVCRRKSNKKDVSAMAANVWCGMWKVFHSFLCYFKEFPTFSSWLE